MENQLFFKLYLSGSQLVESQDLHLFLYNEVGAQS